MSEHRQAVNLADNDISGAPKKIILIGAKGDVGRAAYEQLSAHHDVIRVGRSDGDVIADISDSASIDAMFNEVGKIDALVSTAGAVHFGPLSEFTEQQFMLGLSNKVMGQVNLVIKGMDFINDGGSFTLTSGVLDRDPVVMGASAATANGALGGFVKGAAIEMPRGLRINVVSPGLLDVSEEKFGRYFPGHEVVSSKSVGLAYAKSVDGAITGQVIIV